MELMKPIIGGICDSEKEAFDTMKEAALKQIEILIDDESDCRISVESDSINIDDDFIYTIVTE